MIYLCILTNVEIRTDFSFHSRPYVFLDLTLCAILERPTLGIDNFNMLFLEFYWRINTQPRIHRRICRLGSCDAGST